MSGSAAETAISPIGDQTAEPTLSDIYEQKVSEGRMDNNRRISAQMKLVKALKAAIDDINDNDPFIDIKPSVPSSQSSDHSEYCLILNVQKDGKSQQPFFVKYGDAEVYDTATLIFLVKGQDDVRFEISEGALKMEGAFAEQLSYGLAELMAAQVLKNEPDNLPASKRDRIFEFSR